MSHPIWDCGQDHRQLGEELNYFLYENGKPTLKNGEPGIKAERTYEELWNMLESIRMGAWDSYEEIAEYMGW
jgi:O6-methylguanine-DNA--protein-cysteine methyltransferase